jgi:glycosyltransferase involved in cell wall biosynthesis
MTPLVTIGIPCYNAGNWLRTAIDSALSQQYPEKEVIVVDDGSTDNSLLIAGAYGDRITLTRTPHRGANFARNVVLQESQGEWIQYLDADDYLEPEKISRQFAEAENLEEADVLYSQVWELRTTADGRPEHTRSVLDTKRDLYSQWLTWELPQTGGALWRKSALADLGGWRADQPCCQEHELYLRAIQAGLRFHHTPTPGAVYRIWSEDTLCRKDPRRVIQVKTKLIDHLRDWMQKKKIWTAKHQQLAARACFEMARTLARQDMREAAGYHRERKKNGLIALEGPAAPPSYRLAYSFLGFRGAETLARACRSAA